MPGMIEDTSRFWSGVAIALHRGLGHAVNIKLAPREQDARMRFAWTQLEAMRLHIAQLTTDLNQSKIDLAHWAEREAACCPEDVGFDEYIAVLIRQREDWKKLANAAEVSAAGVVRELSKAEGEAQVMRDALRRIGIFRSDEAEGDGSEWCVTLEPHGEQPAGTLDDALQRTLAARDLDADIVCDEQEHALRMQVEDEVVAWRMLARGEVPVRMTPEQYAFMQERSAPNTTPEDMTHG